MTLLASLTRQELARQVTYLKAENQILRSKLPKRIELSNQERRRLVKQGKSLGARIKDLISIVSYSTFRKWVRNVEDAPDKRPKAKDAKPGRPRVEESISEAIIRIRKETGWGYTKIVQAMRRLGHNISRQTVKNVLVDAGLGPQPHDIRLEHLLATGQVKDQAEIARTAGITRARVTQILNLTQLAPDIQEAILRSVPQVDRRAVADSSRSCRGRLA